MIVNSRTFINQRCLGNKRTQEPLIMTKRKLQMNPIIYLDNGGNSRCHLLERTREGGVRKERWRWLPGIALRGCTVGQAKCPSRKQFDLVKCKKEDKEPNYKLSMASLLNITLRHKRPRKKKKATYTSAVHMFSAWPVFFSLPAQ